MGAFKDKDGNVYTFHISPGSIKRCVDIAKVSPLDIFAPDDAETARRIVDHPEIVADILYACCKPELDGKNISAEQFGESLNGDSLEEGLEAIKDEVVGFSPTSKRQVLQTLRTQQGKMETAAAALVMEKLTDPVLLKQVDQKMRRDLDELLQKHGLTPATTEQG